MNTAKPAVAALQALLISPALLFMGALVVRNLPQRELAANAQRIVMWYAARQWTLWTLLIALPLAVLLVGGLTLLSSRNGHVERPQAVRPTPAAARFVATETFMAGGILAIVALHMMAN
jgi:hypothetical protein